jgi:hypothetical protein
MVEAQQGAGHVNLKQYRRRKGECPVQRRTATLQPMVNRFLIAFLFTTLLPTQDKKPPLYFDWDANSFSTNGRWIPSDPKKKAAYPSETEIDCDSHSKTCVEATAEYFSEHPHVSLSYFQVVKWDLNGIIATSADGICMTRTMVISYADRSISDTYSTKQLDEEKRKACKFFGATGTSSDVFVIKNSDRWIADPYGSNGK